MGQQVNRSQISEVPIGGTLVIAENIEQLEWNGTTKTRWTGGTWTQYGALAQTDRPYYIRIIVPAGKKWTVSLSHLCSTVRSPNGHWSHSGICSILNDYSGPITFLTSSLNANGDNYHPQASQVVQVLTEGTYHFGLWVRTNTTTDSTWYGGGDNASTGSGYGFGRAAVFEARLLDVEDV